MNKLKFFFIIVFFVFFLVALGTPKKTEAKVFVVNLSYNPSSKILAFDSQKAERVSIDESLEISVIEFALEDKEGNYVLKLFDSNNIALAETQFDGQSGSFTVKLPYFSLAKSLKIYEKEQGKELLETDLSSFIACNGNKICEFEKGEHYYTCLEDCGASDAKYSDQTLELLEKNNNIIKDEKTGEILLRNDEQIKTEESKKNKQNVIIIIVVIFVTAAIFIGIIIYRVRKRA